MVYNDAREYVEAALTPNLLENFRQRFNVERDGKTTRDENDRKLECARSIAKEVLLKLHEDEFNQLAREAYSWLSDEWDHENWDKQKHSE